MGTRSGAYKLNHECASSKAYMGQSQSTTMAHPVLVFWYHSLLFAFE